MRRDRFRDGRCSVNEHGPVFKDLLRCGIMETSLIENTHVVLVECRILWQLLIEWNLGILDSLKFKNVLSYLLNALLNGSNLLNLLLLSLDLVCLYYPLLHLLPLHFSFSFLYKNVYLFD